MLRSAIETLRDRGAGVLISAGLNLVRANVQHRLFGRRFMQKRIHDYRMFLDLEDPGISRSLILFGTREVDHKIILEKVLRPGMTVLDIGANIGYYVLMELGLVGPSGLLVAVEPSPANVSLLRRNIALNGYKDVAIFEGAISDRSSRRAFFLSHQSNLNTFHDTGSGAAHLSGETIEVETRTVPDLMNGHGAPDLIRMDVEGHEVEVINGMLEAIRGGRMAPMIIFETHLSRYSLEHDMAQALTGLFDARYQTRYLASSYERGTALIEARGYKGGAPIPTDGVTRVIFEDVLPEDTIDIVCRTGGARTVLLVPPNHAEAHP